MSLDKNTRNKITELLSPLSGNYENRRRLLKSTFDKYDGVNLSSQIDFAGSEAEFADRMIDSLLRYGFVEEDIHSLSALLNEVHPYYGVDKQAEIQELQQIINDRLKRDSRKLIEKEQHLSTPLHLLRPAVRRLLGIGMMVITLIVGLGVGYVLI